MSDDFEYPPSEVEELRSEKQEGGAGGLWTLPDLDELGVRKTDKREVEDET